MPNKKIDDIEIREPQNNKERYLFSLIMHNLKNLQYGNLTFEVRVHNNEITSMRLIKNEETFNLHNV
jgi:hypothetical protein